MPIAVRFDDDDHIVIWEFTGKWTWEEYYNLRDDVNNKIESMPHTVDMIVDMTNGSLLPQSVLTHAGSAARKAPNNLGVIVMVGPSAFLRSFFNFFKRMYNIFRPQQDKNLHMVGTLDEAYAILRQPKYEK